MYYDLHIHSCLSPCADDSMTPNNIVNMAMLNGLSLISVCDHNSMLQQKVIAKLAKEKGIAYIYGVEVSTIEEVHVLVYFKDERPLDAFQNFLDEHLIVIQNRKDYFGNQLVMNEYDEVISEKDELLLSSLDVSLEELSKKAKELSGIVVLAHVNGRKNSVLTQLGFIPETLSYDGLELTDEKEMGMFQKEYPDVSLFLKSSDAHRLEDILEKSSFLEEEVYQRWFQ